MKGWVKLETNPPSEIWIPLASILAVSRAQGSYMSLFSVVHVFGGQEFLLMTTPKETLRLIEEKKALDAVPNEDP